jgi:23S rRNA (adenine2030-N6)-methyltransferase
MGIMLSYRHGFHAGNSADVLKHTILVFCLDYLVQKEKPFLCVDTHAGAGSYPLLTGFAAQNREWEQGIAKLRDFPAPGNTDREGQRVQAKVPPLVRRYRELIPDEGSTYPGSPVLMARLLRARDRALCFELHPGDFAALSEFLKDDRRFSIRQEDGFAALKGLLPPPSRRGLVLIDPPYELKEDYARLVETLSEALERFPTGLYIVWYPLLRNDPRPDAGNSPPFGDTLLGLYGGNRCRVEFYTPEKPRSSAEAKGISPRGFYGSGMVIYNPPWTLGAALEESLPWLGEIMGTGQRGWRLDIQ